ncbi:nucleotidyltransferase family protein [Rhodococcus sp. NPDC060090]|uniref:nucleotidyltransferase family protein n=1 Tax=Rhodococcus sp. NPDC060090 TaxID=3347056 RepID=UPI0036611F5E
MNTPVRSTDSTRIMAVLVKSAEDIRRIAAEYGATDLKIFGSVARGDAGPHSDVDLAVTLPGRRVDKVMSMLGLGEELSALLGVRVDVVARGVLEPEYSSVAQREEIDL